MSRGKNRQTDINRICAELEFARIKDFTDYESSKEENALHDAMTTVTKFLGIKDLCRTAQVCR